MRPGPRQPFEPEMILIPAGEFLMGSDRRKDRYANENEQPQHRLHLPDYWIARTPVTSAQYLAFVQATGHRRPGHWEGGAPRQGQEQHPVVNVAWYDAMAYCRWLAEVTDQPYGLPSEAEWEKAARGTDGRIYPWGNDPPDEGRGNYAYNAGGITPVGQYSPRGDSPYGCVDIVGNVWEWTRTLSGTRYPYDPDDGREDLEAGGARVVRGGAFNFNARYVRCAARYRNLADVCYSDNGFRVVAGPGFRLGPRSPRR